MFEYEPPQKIKPITLYHNLPSGKQTWQWEIPQTRASKRGNHLPTFFQIAMIEYHQTGFKPLTVENEYRWAVFVNIHPTYMANGRF